MILLENTANEKNTVGGTFTDVGAIADGVGNADRIGFCFDTCHAGAAGYDIPGHGAETVFGWFADEAGSLDRLKVIHLNDMKGARYHGTINLFSRLQSQDRHRGPRRR